MLTCELLIAFTPFRHRLLPESAPLSPPSGIQLDAHYALREQNSQESTFTLACPASCACHEPCQPRPLLRSQLEKTYCPFSGPFFCLVFSAVALTSPLHRGRSRCPLKTTPTRRPVSWPFVVEGRQTETEQNTKKRP